MSVSSIHEISSLMKHSQQMINTMKQLSLKSELTAEEYAWFSRSKIELRQILNKLKTLNPDLVLKVKKRQSKRRRQRGKKLERKRRKETAKEREEVMDEWMRQRQKEDELKEMTLKNSRILSGKVSEIEKHLSLLSQLEKLNKTRGGNIELATPRLSARLRQLRDQMEKENDDVDESCDYLFNMASRPDELDPVTLLAIRNDWDQFISTEATATSIPSGWVTPSTPCEHCQQGGVDP